VIKRMFLALEKNPNHSRLSSLAIMTTNCIAHKANTGKGAACTSSAR
jgi:hypothetical protein